MRKLYVAILAPFLLLAISCPVPVKVDDSQKPDFDKAQVTLDALNTKLEVFTMEFKRLNDSVEVMKPIVESRLDLFTIELKQLNNNFEKLQPTLDAMTELNQQLKQLNQWLREHGERVTDNPMFRKPK